MTQASADVSEHQMFIDMCLDMSNVLRELKEKLTACVDASVSNADLNTNMESIEVRQFF